jgi:hypothetical protein
VKCARIRLAVSRAPHRQLPRVAIRNAHAEHGSGTLKFLHLIVLLRLGGIIIAPQPSERFWQVHRSLRDGVQADAKTEVEIIVFQLEAVGELNVIQGPASGVSLPIVGAVGHPHTQILFRPAPDVVRYYITAVLIPFRALLNSAVTANVRQHAAELIRIIPSDVERADRARDRSRVSVMSDLVGLSWRV